MADDGKVAVVVVEIGQVGVLGIEVVAVLGAAEAGLAVRVRHVDKGRLAVDALNRQQRADAAAPAALAVEESRPSQRPPPAHPG